MCSLFGLNWLSFSASTLMHVCLCLQCMLLFLYICILYITFVFGLHYLLLVQNKLWNLEFTKPNMYKCAVMRANWFLINLWNINTVITRFWLISERFLGQQDMSITGLWVFIWFLSTDSRWISWELRPAYVRVVHTGSYSQPHCGGYQTQPS